MIYFDFFWLVNWLKQSAYTFPQLKNTKRQVQLFGSKSGSETLRQSWHGNKGCHPSLFLQWNRFHSRSSTGVDWLLYQLISAYFYATLCSNWLKKICHFKYKTKKCFNLSNSNKVFEHHKTYHKYMTTVLSEQYYNSPILQIQK